MTVTRFDDLDGRPIATLVNYGCHPTTLGPDNNLLSADFPGVVCTRIEEALGGVAIFSTGPQGDVNPGGYSPEGSMVGVVVSWRTAASVEQYGRAIADVAIDVHRDLRPVPSDRVWGAVPDRRASPQAAARRGARSRSRREAARSADSVGRAALSPDATYHAIVAAAYADLAASQAADPARDRPVPVRISALALGPLMHVGVSGELFVALGPTDPGRTRRGPYLHRRPVRRNRGLPADCRCVRDRWLRTERERDHSGRGRTARRRRPRPAALLPRLPEPGSDQLSTVRRDRS